MSGPKKIEGLRLFCARAPFAEMFGTLLDREGPWTDEMHDDFDDEDGPGTSGLWVWEGSCEVERVPGLGNEHEFTGVWRAPTPEEMALLAAGKMPLRDRPFPHESNLDTFEPMNVLVERAASGHEAGAS